MSTGLSTNPAKSPVHFRQQRAIGALADLGAGASVRLLASVIVAVAGLERFLALFKADQAGTLDYAFLQPDAVTPYATGAGSVAVTAATEAVVSVDPHFGEGLVKFTYTAVDALLAKATLAKAAVAEKFKTTTVAHVRIAGVEYTKAATDNLTFTLAHKVTATKFGTVLVQIDAAGTISTKVAGANQAYNSAPLALAALPAPDASKVALGYLAIAAGVADWTANTDDLTNGSDLTTAAFTDGAEIPAATVTYFDLAGAPGNP